MSYQLYRGDCLDILPTLEENSVDSIITDPPGGISFMGKKWDSNRGGRDRWIEWLTAVLSECYRILKPGGMCLVWAIPRTSHWTGMAIEGAGFEVRDQIYHLFGSGFPKSHNISAAIDKTAGVEREVIGRNPNGRQSVGNVYHRAASGTPVQPLITLPATDVAQQFAGYGTALKPAAEVWWLAMKPLPSTFAANALAHGVAGLWIDGARIPGPAWHRSTTTIDDIRGDNYNRSEGRKLDTGAPQSSHTNGRWPANLILDPEAAALLDEQSGERRSSCHIQQSTSQDNGAQATRFGVHGKSWAIPGENTYSDTGGASRFFYTAKASKRERNQGMPDGRTNKHPTVKPLELCRYLCRLTRTPTGGVVLDPFMGSGSIGIAAVAEGRDFVGIEQDRESFETAAWRIEHEYWREDVQLEGVQLELTA